MKRDGRESHKDDKCDDFLDHFELHEREGAAVSFEADAICRHLKAVLEERDSPREENDEDKRCSIGDETGALQFEMTIPGQRHEDIRR